MTFLFTFHTAEGTYAVRGRRVEEAYRRYVADLNAFREKLVDELKRASMDVEKELEEQRAPVPYGYQILPKIVPDGSRPEKQSALVPDSFSWTRTERFISGEQTKIVSAAQLEVREKVSRYRDFIRNQKLIDEHLQYNWFWQKAIEDDKPRFDRQTATLDAILQGKRDVGRSAPRVPSFIRIVPTEPHSWLVHIPVYSDITDSDFLRRVKQSVEDVWKYSDDLDRFRVEVEFRSVSPESLYGSEKPPAPGEHIDLQKHIARISDGAAILTTGANSTHVNGRYLALGPADITKTTLAHEFGHILGFPDEYVRGYRDRGEDGYEVLEVVPDPDDIMCASGTGRVQRRHFEMLIQSK